MSTDHNTALLLEAASDADAKTVTKRLRAVLTAQRQMRIRFKSLDEMAEIRRLLAELDGKINGATASQVSEQASVVAQLPEVKKRLQWLIEVFE